MSISKIHDAQAPPEAVPPVPFERDTGAFEASAESPLAQAARSAAFASVLSRLQAGLEHMDRPGAGMVDTLSGNITHLQDSFIEALYSRLITINADMSSKLTLRLNDQAQLTVVGEHPDRLAISALFALHTEFSAAFTEIAAQSAALRDLRSLCVMASCASSDLRHFALASEPGEPVYQLSLKGDMNHFYFMRRSLPS